MLGTIETRVGLLVLGALAVFAYMGFQIGSFRFDKGRYTTYTVYFKDISGLSKKAEVKIAGVKVGWVEKVDLVSDHEMVVAAQVMVLKDFKLYSNAHAMVRQEGLLGPKYLEIVPGDPLLPQLPPGASLTQPSRSPISVEDVVRQFSAVARNVESITESFNQVVGGVQGTEHLRTIFNNIQETSEQIAAFTKVIHGAVGRNEDNLNSIFEIGNHIRDLSDTLHNDLIPTFKAGIEGIQNTFDRDFDRVASRLESTASAFEEASAEARIGFKNIGSVAQKIDEGRGLFGKLINEDETYRDLKLAVNGVKNYFAKVDTLQIVFDNHFESFHRPAENYQHEDIKGFLDIRIHPSDDHFYLVQFSTSERGYARRVSIQREYFDEDGRRIPEIDLRDTRDVAQFFEERRAVFERFNLKVGLQFGKIFNRVALRLGVFENTAGVGVDLDVPLDSDKFRWVTSFEAYEFTGWNRKGAGSPWDRRPHLKWLNRVFFMRNIYFTFGADDFVSKRNGNAFFGGGLRFGDDDFKYVISGFSNVLGYGGGTAISTAV